MNSHRTKTCGSSRLHGVGCPDSERLEDFGRVGCVKNLDLKGGGNDWLMPTIRVEIPVVVGSSPINTPVFTRDLTKVVWFILRPYLLRSQ